jgi:hypothetical protein
MVTVGFVGSLYLPLILWNCCCIGKRDCGWDKDNPRVIVLRMIGAGLYTCIGLLYINERSLLYRAWNGTMCDTIHPWFWLWCLLSIYMCQILDLAIDIYHPARCEYSRDDVIISTRNYIIAPILEELVFRGWIMHLLALYKCSPYWSAVLFGLAHSHHWILVEKAAFSISAMIVQFLYTFLFGLYCAFLIVVAHNPLWVCIASHMICNFFGLPEFHLSNISQFRSHPLRIIGNICQCLGLFYFLRSILNSSSI